MSDGTEADAGGSTSEFLARIAADEAGPGGSPLGNEAQRLVLDSRAVGGVDAARLVQRMRASPAFVAGRREGRPLIDAIESYLDPIATRRFERELDRANITDSGFERAVEKTGGGLFGIGRFLDKAIHWVDDHVRDVLHKAHDWAERVSADPHANPLLRIAAGVVDTPIKVVETAYDTVSAPVLRVTRAVEDVAEIGNFAYRVATREHYRDALFAMGRLALIESADKVGHDVIARADKALDNLEDGLVQAIRTGKQSEYLASLSTKNGLDLFSGVLPTNVVASLGLDSLDRIAGTLDRLSLDQTGEVRTVLGNAANAIARGGAAGDAGSDIWRDLVRDFRDDGRLVEMTNLARDSGHLDTLLALGELSPKELVDLRQHDPALFATQPVPPGAADATPQKTGSLTFDDALAASIARLDPAKLDARGAGELAESVMTRDLLRNGYTDIAAISHHGDLTLAGRNAQGQLERFDVDAAAIAAAAKTLPASGADAVDRIAALVDTDPRLHGAAATTDVRTAETQATTATRVEPGNPYAALARSDVRLDDPAHHDHASYLQAVQGVEALDARLGRASDAGSLQLGGALTVAARRAGFTSIDHVVLSDDASRVFAVQGDLNSPTHKLAFVETVTARQQTLVESTAQIAEAEANQAHATSVEKAGGQHQNASLSEPGRTAIAV